VRVGQRQGDLVVLEEGVKAGERVILTGQLAVAPGAGVTVVEEGGQGGGAEAASGGGM
jgi:multidrug efflux pump subunit AcrA (membrane-fusion protein)